MFRQGLTRLPRHYTKRSIGIMRSVGTPKQHSPQSFQRLGPYRTPAGSDAHSRCFSANASASTVDGEEQTKNQFTLTFHSDSSEATTEFGKKAAQLSKPGDVLLLSGPLGSGKSEFARAFIREKVRDESLEVPSPTFVIEYSYEAQDKTMIRHIDLFRVNPEKDMSDAVGSLESSPNSIALVEWPEELPMEKLPEAFAACFFVPSSQLESDSLDLGRQIVLVASGSNDEKKKEIFDRYSRLSEN
eukprot:gb/GECG01002190.1/.p1 GENE.gb/GECG01002190.1/~~gb/GECG01002190.1/.p1  ORF type:complete len:244 (+),score=36.85 gb/GECG01002190.1/:1-732(+)